jgi:hypothetical protein
MRSILASRRQHPSYVHSYVVPEPISHVRVFHLAESTGEPEVANVVDLAAARARLRSAS